MKTNSNVENRYNSIIGIDLPEFYLIKGNYYLRECNLIKKIKYPESNCQRLINVKEIGNNIVYDKDNQFKVLYSPEFCNHKKISIIFELCRNSNNLYVEPIIIKAEKCEFNFSETKITEIKKDGFKAIFNQLSFKECKEYSYGFDFDFDFYPDDKLSGFYELVYLKMKFPDELIMMNKLKLYNIDSQGILRGQCTTFRIKTEKDIQIWELNCDCKYFKRKDEKSDDICICGHESEMHINEIKRWESPIELAEKDINEKQKKIEYFKLCIKDHPYYGYEESIKEEEYWIERSKNEITKFKNKQKKMEEIQKILLNNKK